MKNSAGLGLVLAASLLASCGSGEGEGGLTREENEGLNEAANMVETLDVSPDSMTVSEGNDLGSGDDAAVNDSGGDEDATGNAAVNAQ
jgi:hypothetical protein